ncbi:MAG: hypothetical protein JRJ71_11785 [Deltaproteobacteria bacterium]|nr:hypothetical protein [Deltaproteobacteria bacterium]
MLEKAKYLEIHSKFYDYLLRTSFPPEGYLPYGTHEIPPGIANGPEWFIFASQAKELVREILNSANQFYSQIIRLGAWAEVLEEYEGLERFNIVAEIIEPFASHIINSVYMIKGRMAFVTSILLHHTFCLFEQEWKDTDFKGNKFYFVQVYGQLKKYKEYTGSSDTSDKLHSCLDQIDDEAFREATKEFRGRFQHMIPPNIEVGLSGLVNRMESKDGKVSYGIGGQKPLSLKDVLPHLTTQHDRCVEAFKVFWELMQEMLEIWKQERPNI